MTINANEPLAGRVALVTGTSPNIGGTAAAGLAAAGATVVCTDIDTDTAAAAAAVIRDAGGTAMSLAFDVTDEDAVKTAVAQVLSTYGKIDVLVNNAVKFSPGGVLNMEVAQFRRQIDVIVGGAFLMTQAVASAMVAGAVRGSIINVLSTAAYQGQSGNIGYATAKSGLVNFTRATAMELAPHGIRVNSFTPTATIPPGDEAAARFQNIMDKSAERGLVDFERLNPWDRLPGPEDYVGAVVFLASDASAMMTGSDLRIDGGALAKYWPQIPQRAAEAADEGDV